jgi:hypothetical protein
LRAFEVTNVTSIAARDATTRRRRGDDATRARQSAARIEVPPWRWRAR